MILKLNINKVLNKTYEHYIQNIRYEALRLEGLSPHQSIDHSCECSHLFHLYTRNNKGPKNEPCDTFGLRLSQADVYPAKSTNCFHSKRYHSKILSIISLIQ